VIADAVLASQVSPADRQILRLMNSLRFAVLVTCVTPLLHAETAPPLPHAVASSLDEFLGEPEFMPMQQLWEKRGGWGGIITTPDGTVVAFQSPGGPTCRRSVDGGKTWGSEIFIGEGATGGNAVIDEASGDLLYVNPHPGWLYRSADAGATWTKQTITVTPDNFGLIPKLEGVAAMQCGITLAFGPKRGRLMCSREL
jgi:hypothetical protein